LIFRRGLPGAIGPANDAPTGHARGIPDVLADAGASAP